jgi:hypothetical protein
MLAYNLNCWLMLFHREGETDVLALGHTTLATARLRFLFVAAKIWRHAGRTGVSYSDHYQEKGLILSQSRVVTELDQVGVNADVTKRRVSGGLWRSKSSLDLLSSELSHRIDVEGKMAAKNTTNRTEPKTVGQWIRYIVVAVIALFLVWWMFRLYVL